MPHIINSLARRCRCAWSRARLPLLAGGELLGIERRRVERHVLVCADCRAGLAAATQAIETLRTAAATSPTMRAGVPDVAQPSLWPELRRQIAESGRTVPRAWRWELWPTFDGLTWASSLPRLALGLAVCLIASGVYVGTLVESKNARERIARNARPVASDVFEESDEPDVEPLVVEAEIPTEPTVTVPTAALVDRAPAPATKFGYDLEGGTPMPIGAHDVKPSY